MDRNARSRQPQRRKGIERRAKSTEAVEFFNVLTSPEVLDATEALSPEHRERLYPPTVTLSMFMRQTLEADGSCQKAVNRWAAQRVADGLCPSSTRTGGYCRARARLPLSMVSGLAQETGRQLHQRACLQWCWRGRAVKLVDGTGLSMPDTQENQACYPQPSTQAKGVWLTTITLAGVLPHEGMLPGEWLSFHCGFEVLFIGGRGLWSCGRRARRGCPNFLRARRFSELGFLTSFYRYSGSCQAAGGPRLRHVLMRQPCLYALRSLLGAACVKRSS